MKKIAVTGVLGAGKSTVCRLMEKFGAKVVDADKIAHRLIEGPCCDDVIQLLGPEIDRQKIAQKVFEDRELLRQLESILHPPILKEIQKEIALAKSIKTPLFVCEVPLLFELGWDQYFDTTICVVSNRSPDSPRMQYQWSEQEKSAKADYIIKNNGLIEELEKQITHIIGA